MKRHDCVVLISLFVPSMLTLAAPRPPDIPFKVHQIDIGASESVAVADINRDGKLDIISGDYWYEAPSWKKHKFRELSFWNNYLDDFSDLPLDVDGDGWVDIVAAKYFDQKLVWFRNPGKAGGMWKETVVHSGFRVEYAILADVDNDGRANEIVPMEWEAEQAWYEAKNGTLVRHVISSRPSLHGIGVGDINKDGRNDILTPEGWYEAPADPRNGQWTFHADWQLAAFPKLSFMYVADLNGDGRNDVITAVAHDYGVFWLEQEANGHWTRHDIDMNWSQAHASTLVDLNGDGQLDFLTGKRFVMHGDPGEREPLGIYWYEHRFSAQAPMGQHIGAATAPGLEWIRHIIAYGGPISAGVQIPAVDIDGDGDLDILCPGQTGLFLLENLSK